MTPGVALRAIGAVVAILAACVPVSYAAAVAPGYALAGAAAAAFAAAVLLRPDLVLLCLVAALPWEGALAPPSAPLPVVKLLGAALIASWVLRLARGREPVRLPPVLLFVATLVFAVGVSFITAPDLSASPAKTASYVLFAMFFFIVVQLVPDPKAVRRVLIVLTLSSAVSGLRGLFDFLVLGVPRAAGPILDPNDFAYAMAAALPFAGYLAITEPRLRPLWWGCAVAIAAAVAGSLSRGAIVGLLVVLLWAIVTGRIPVRRLVAGGVTLLAVAAALAPGLTPLVSERVASKNSYGAKNVDSRAAFWRGALAMTADRPITGVGPGRFGTEAEHYVRRNPVILDNPLVHNSYLEVLAESGVVALLAFLAFIGASWRLLVVGRRRSLEEGDRDAARLATAMQSTLIVAVVSGCFISAQLQTPFWLLGGLAAAFAGTTVREAARTSASGRRTAPAAALGRPRLA